MAGSKTSVEALTYEQALAELEEITHRLEETPPPLEETLTLFERGQFLALRCVALLDQADLKLRTLSGEELESLGGK